MIQLQVLISTFLLVGCLTMPLYFFSFLVNNLLAMLWVYLSPFYLPPATQLSACATQLIALAVDTLALLGT